MDQSPDDVYPYEFYVRLKLDEWARFKSGEGVAGVVHSTLGLSEERMMMIDGYRDNDKLKINTAEAERTNRVVERMKKEDMRGWRVLSHYHFKSKITPTSPPIVRNFSPSSSKSSVGNGPDPTRVV